MFCSRCGTQNDDKATQCVRCASPIGAQPGPGAPPAGFGQPQFPPQPQAWQQPQYGQRPDVPNYLVWAILSTLFCCLPFGIVSIVYSTQVNSKLTVGDVAGALESSRKAKTWAWVSFGVGIGLFLVWMGLAVIGAIAGAAGGLE